MADTNLVLMGAVAEMFAELVSQKQLLDDGTANPEVKDEDLRTKRQLEKSLEDLQHTIGVRELIGHATQLLREECRGYSNLITDVAAELADIQVTERSLATGVSNALNGFRELLWLFARRRESKLFFSSLGTLGLANPRGELTVEQIESTRVDVEAVSRVTDRLTEVFGEAARQFSQLVVRLADFANQLGNDIGRGEILVSNALAAKLTEDDKIGSLSVNGRQFDFLEFSKPLALSNLKCSSAMSLYLNIAEDVHSGQVQVKQSSPVSKSYGEFINGSEKVDNALQRITELKGRLSKREHTYRVLAARIASDFRLETLKQASMEYRDNVKAAKVMLKRGEELARLGATDHAQSLCEKATQLSDGTVDVSSVEPHISAALSKLDLIDLDFQRVNAEFSKQNQGFRKFWGEGIGNSHANLRECLGRLLSHQEVCKWGAGTLMSRKYLAMVQQSQEACEACDFEAATYLWVLLTSLIEKLPARQLNQEAVFLNAMCAMAAIDGKFTNDEVQAIKKTLEYAKVSINSDQIIRWCQEWAKISDNQLYQSMAQAIVDLRTLPDGKLKEMLPACVKAIAIADGEVDPREAALYHGIIAGVWAP